MERNCDNCKYANKSEEEYPCTGCIRNAVDQWEPLTEGDKIRMMEDKDLANFLSTQFCHGFGEQQILEWLRTAVKEA